MRTHPIEAYVENFEGYGDQTTILSKFGIQSTQEITLTISKERFESYLTPLMEGKDNIKISNRPKEGDLIYFPLGDRLFEIKFVEHEKPFYQLQKGYVYTLKCELFRYENEVIDTDIAEIDDSIAGTLGASDSELLGGDAMTTLLSVVGVGTTALATTGYVSDGGIRMISVTNRGGGYTYNPDVKISIAPSGGITGVATAERISGIVACELNANPVAESIQKVFLTNPGAGYTEAPSVRFAGDGVGAATSIIGDGVIGIVTITGGGSGYTTATAPVVTFSGSATVSADLLQSESVLLEQSVTSTLPMLVWDTLRHQPSPSRHQTKLELEHSRRTKLSLDLFLDLQQEFSIGLPMEENWKSTDQTEILLLGNRLLEFLSSSASYKLSAASYPETGFTANEEIEGEADNIIDFTETNPFGMP